MNVVASNKSVYERVVRNNKIRAGYITYSPGVYEDTYSQELSGIVVEVLNKAASNLGLEVEYAEKVAWGDMFDALNCDRLDLTLYVWPNGTRAREADCLMPLYYNAINAYARVDDKRFDEGFSQAVKKHDIRIAAVKGEISSMLAQSDFPELKTHNLPENADASSMLTSVADGSADMVFCDAVMTHEFNTANPGRLKNVTPNRPIRVYPSVIMLKRNQFEFKVMMDRAFEELHNSGIIDRIIDKYEPFPGAVNRLALPYRCVA